MEISYTVASLVEKTTQRLGLQCWSGTDLLDRLFSQKNFLDNSTGLVGYFNVIHLNQVQVLGSTEIEYINNLSDREKTKAFSKLFHQNVIAIFVTEDLDPPPMFKQHSAKAKIPIILSTASSNEVINELRYYLTRMLAERITLHGVFMEVISIGVLIAGDAGVGKSELALELISRGHRLIADDAPEFTKIAPDIINGTCPLLLQDFLEVRGLGVINIRAMYGDSAIKSNKYLRLIVALTHVDEVKKRSVDRLQIRDKTKNILGLDIPLIHVPVGPGRNLAVLVEAAVRNHLLRQNNYNAAEEFAARQRKAIKDHTK